MKFGEIYTYKNAEEAKQYIGKKGVFSDTLKRITECPKQCWESSLTKVEEEKSCPFNGKGLCSFQFFRPILEEELMMTHRQLTEWLAKGEGEYTCYDKTMVGQKIVSPNNGYLEGQEDEPVEDYILIRRWKDTEWSKPTKEIYEEDCLTNTVVNKEDCK